MPCGPVPGLFYTFFSFHRFLFGRKLLLLTSLILVFFLLFFFSIRSLGISQTYSLSFLLISTGKKIIAPIFLHNVSDRHRPGREHDPGEGSERAARG